MTNTQVAPTPSLHRYIPASLTGKTPPAPGDLTTSDLAVLWGIMKAENLVAIFFHDGSVRSLPAFIAFAEHSWLYGVRFGGAFIGFGVANMFSSSKRAAHVHLCSFRNGRLPGNSAHSPFAQAGRQWFDLLQRGGLATCIALFPACYRTLVPWVTSFGFVERMRLPGALHVVRGNGSVRVSDALVYERSLHAR